MAKTFTESGRPTFHTSSFTGGAGRPSMKKRPYAPKVTPASAVRVRRVDPATLVRKPVSDQTRDHFEYYRPFRRDDERAS